MQTLRLVYSMSKVPNYNLALTPPCLLTTSSIFWNW